MTDQLREVLHDLARGLDDLGRLLRWLGWVVLLTWAALVIVVAYELTR